jgi:NTE family protein
VGVIKALAQLKLKPDLVVGASAGALVGVLVAAGRSASDIEQIALDLSALEAVRLAVGGQARFSGSPLADLVREHAGITRLEDSRTPVACVALRANDRHVVTFTQGDVGVAVQASAAIEGQLTPVRIRGQHHVDADLVMPMPVRVAKRLGAKVVIAVDASVHMDRVRPAGAERFRDGDVRKQQLTQVDAAQADLVLKPDFGYWVSLSREFRERAIQAGYDATLAQAARLKALHGG